MNLKRNRLFDKKLSRWSAVFLAGLVLWTLGPGSAWADDDDDTDEAWLGVALQELTPSLREALELGTDVRGLVIAGVMDGSPAEKAGLQEQDVIVSLNGRGVDSIEEATEMVRGMKPKSRLTVSVLREGKRRQFTANLAEREDREDSGWLHDLERQHGNLETPMPPMPPMPPEPEVPGQEDMPSELSNRGYLGVTTIDLGDQLAEYFGVEGNGGVLVTEVSKDSPAEQAGLHAGDIILSVNRSKVDSPADLLRLIRAHDAEDQVDVVIQRKGEQRTLNATLGKAKEFGLLAPRARHMMLDQEMRERMREHQELLQEVQPHQLIRMHRRSGAEI